MKDMVHFLRGGPGGGPGGCPRTSAPQNVVFPMVLEPRDSKMLYFLSFWSLEILKCCISVTFGASRFGNGIFPVVLEPRDLKMLYFHGIWSLEIWKYRISISFGM